MCDFSSLESQKNYPQQFGTTQAGFSAEDKNTFWKFNQRGKYHCAADLMFDWFGFDQTSKTALNAKYLSKAAESKQNKQEVSRTVVPTSP